MGNLGMAEEDGPPDEGPDAETVEGILAKFDKDGDSKLSKTEFLAGIKEEFDDKEHLAEFEGKLEKHWPQVDKDADGLLDLAELTELELFFQDDHVKEEV